MAASNLLATFYVLLATCTSYIAFVTYQHRLKIHKLQKQGYVSYTRWFLVVSGANFYFASLVHLDGAGNHLELVMSRLTFNQITELLATPLILGCLIGQVQPDNHF